MAAAAVEALSPEEAAAVRAEAERSAGRHQGKVDPRSLEEAVAASSASVRERRCGCPG